MSAPPMKARPPAHGAQVRFAGQALENLAQLAGQAAAEYVELGLVIDRDPYHQAAAAGA